MVKNGTERQQALSIFGAKPGAKSGDVLFFLADAIAITVQYANRTGLCKMLDGFQKKDLMEQLKILNAHARDTSVKIEDYDRMQMLTNLSTAEDNQMRQWNYQFCNEFGWFQIPSPVSESHQMRSQLLGLDYWYELCQDLFGRDIAASRQSNM